MRLIFVFSRNDSIFLIKAVYDMLIWLTNNKNTRVIIYLPRFGIFKDNSTGLEIRYYNTISAERIPESDIIISSNYNLLKELIKMKRGILLFFNDKDIVVEDFEIIDFSLLEIGLGISPDFYTYNGEKKKNLIIAGDRLSLEDYDNVFSAIDRASSSFYPDEIYLFNPDSEINIEAPVNYNIISERDLDVGVFLRDSFYLVWIGKTIYPILALQAMAAGVLVIGVNCKNTNFKYPVQINDLESLELALELMKTYKIGQYRNRILHISAEICRGMKLDLVGNRWYSYFESLLLRDNCNNDLAVIELNNKCIHASREFYNGKVSPIIAGIDRSDKPVQIVAAGISPWNYPMDRMKELIKTLANKGYHVLYINPDCRGGLYQEIGTNILSYSPAGSGSLFYCLQHGLEEELGKEIAEIIKGLEFNNYIFMTNAPFWLEILKYLEYSILVYDCIDNYGEINSINYDYELLQKYEKQLFNLSDMVLTNTKKSYLLKKNVNTNTYLLRDGYKVKLYKGFSRSENRKHDGKFKRIVAVYYNFLRNYSELILIENAVRKYQGVKFVLLGHISVDISPLLELKNFVFDGENDLSGNEVISNFDLIIIPYLNIKGNKEVNYINIYNFISAGGRVLVNKCLGEEYKDLIDIEEDEDDFIERIGQILSENDDLEEKVKRFNKIKKFTWANRGENLDRRLHLAYPGLFPDGGNTAGQELFEEDLSFFEKIKTLFRREK